MAKKKNYKPLMALVALAAAALVAATVTFTNVTYWLINATKPPAMKYPGADTAVAGGQYVKVSYYYDSGINITRISIIGFTGDPTNYTSVIKVCNYYGTTSITNTLCPLIDGAPGPNSGCTDAALASGGNSAYASASPSLKVAISITRRPPANGASALSTPAVSQNGTATISTSAHFANSSSDPASDLAGSTS